MGHARSVSRRKDRACDTASGSRLPSTGRRRLASRKPSRCAPFPLYHRHQRHVWGRGSSACASRARPLAALRAHPASPAPGAPFPALCWLRPEPGCPTELAAPSLRPCKCGKWELGKREVGRAELAAALASLAVQCVNWRRRLSTCRRDRSFNREETSHSMEHSASVVASIHRSFAGGGWEAQGAHAWMSCAPAELECP